MGVYSNEIIIQVVPRSGGSQGGSQSGSEFNIKKPIEIGVLAALGMAGLYYMFKKRGK